MIDKGVEARLGLYLLLQCAVRFIDYAPMVFRRLRAIFGIDSLLYIRSVGPEQLLGNLILGMMLHSV